MDPLGHRNTSGVPSAETKHRRPLGSDACSLFFFVFGICPAFHCYTASSLVTCTTEVSSVWSCYPQRKGLHPYQTVEMIKLFPYAIHRIVVEFLRGIYNLQSFKSFMIKTQTSEYPEQNKANVLPRYKLECQNKNARKQRQSSIKRSDFTFINLWLRQKDKTLWGHCCWGTTERLRGRK